MKHFIVFLIVIMLTSCKKDELFVYEFPKLNKLLVSVTRTGLNSEFNAEFEYDSLNRLTAVTNFFPESQTVVETYVYDDEERIIEKRIGNSLTTYTYNQAGELVEQNIHYTTAGDDNEWDEKTEFIHKNGRITKGIEYSAEGEIIRYITYKYDSRGNTLEKIVQPAGFEFDFNLVEIKFKYDTKVNPLAGTGINMLNGFSFTQHADVVQVNNPVYAFYENLIMSSMPPKYEISYEYDPDGFPISAALTNLHYADQEPFHVVYEYRELEN